MTVRIIKGPPTFKPVELTCPRCHAVFVADSAADFKREYYSDFRESWDYAVIPCPCCDGQVKAVKESFPDHVYEDLERVRR